MKVISHTKVDKHGTPLEKGQRVRVDLKEHGCGTGTGKLVVVGDEESVYEDGNLPGTLRISNSKIEIISNW